MKSTCVRHPERESLIIIRQWQVEFCEGNRCAAALLSFFEYWHNIKLEQSYKACKLNNLQVMRKFDDKQEEDESLFQFHTNEELENGIMGLYKRDKINKSIDFLKDKGVISIHRNPNKKYKYDRTRYFLFYPDTLNNWLESQYTHLRKTDTRAQKNRRLSPKNRRLSPKNRRPITEITTETSSETSFQSTDPRFLDPWPENFREVKPEKKDEAFRMVESWLEKIPPNQRRVLEEKIRQQIIEREIENEWAYRIACLYNKMMTRPAITGDWEPDELEFATEEEI